MSGVEGAEREDHDECEAGVGGFKRPANRERRRKKAQMEDLAGVHNDAFNCEISETFSEGVVYWVRAQPVSVQEPRRKTKIEVACYTQRGLTLGLVSVE